MARAITSGGSSRSTSSPSSSSSSRKRKKTSSKSRSKSTSSSKKRTTASSTSDFEHVNTLKQEMQDAALQRQGVSLASLGLSNVTQVSLRSSEYLIESIDSLVLRIVQEILQGKGLTFKVPSRNYSNTIYIPELDRVVLNDVVSHRTLTSAQTVRKTAIMTRVLALIREILGKKIHVTKRDLFYTDVKLFVDQKQTDVILEDIACMLGSTRTSLNVVASEKGVVVGRLQFEEAGDLIDCTKMGIGGKAIPPSQDRCTNITSDAKFILLVEKDAAFMRLAEDRFYNKFPCIIITAKGQPDVATRLFLRRLRDELKIPVLGLVDSDPYGLKILSVYLSGSKNMSYDSANLTTPDIKWLGVRPSDLEKYNIPQQCRLKMTDEDIRTGKAMLQEDFIKQNKEWVKELQLMMKSKEKAEIQALSSFGFQFLTEEYLPRKLREGDWI
eukprot:g1805.t1